MNTYKQDNTIPIYISLQYDHYFLKFPINPECLRKERSSPSNTVEVEGIGQVSVPKTPELARITIDSFFWQNENLLPSFMYVDWLERWQSSGNPANLIVTRFNYSMQVTCENFDHEIRAGEEEDVYFTLEMQEYRPHEAKKIGLPSNKTLLQRVQQVTNIASEVTPILVDIPRPTRNSTGRKSFSNPYVCKQNETLCGITRKITGNSDDWKSLYDENKEILADILGNESNIPENTKLTLPQSWVSNKNYNIIQGAV